MSVIKKVNRRLSGDILEVYMSFGSSDKGILDYDGRRFRYYLGQDLIFLG
jgi:hypothetical protein